MKPKNPPKFSIGDHVVPLSEIKLLGNDMFIQEYSGSKPPDIFFHIEKISYSDKEGYFYSGHLPNGQIKQLREDNVYVSSPVSYENPPNIERYGYKYAPTKDSIFEDMLNRTIEATEKSIEDRLRAIDETRRFLNDLIKDSSGRKDRGNK